MTLRRQPRDLSPHRHRAVTKLPCLRGTLTHVPHSPPPCPAALHRRARRPTRDHRHGQQPDLRQSRPRRCRPNARRSQRQIWRNLRLVLRLYVSTRLLAAQRQRLLLRHALRPARPRLQRRRHDQLCAALQQNHRRLHPGAIWRHRAESGFSHAGRYDQIHGKRRHPDDVPRSHVVRHRHPCGAPRDASSLQRPSVARRRGYRRQRRRFDLGERRIRSLYLPLHGRRPPNLRHSATRGYNAQTRRRRFVRLQ